MRNRIHEDPAVFDRARTARERDGGFPVDAHSVVADRDDARRVDHEADGNRGGRVVLDLDDHNAATTVANRVDALDRPAARDTQHGVRDRRGVPSRPVRRPVATRHHPSLLAAYAPSEPQRAPMHGAQRVDLGDDPGRQRADTEHRRSRHRIPWSSGFALRSISSGTRSAGRAPSWSTRRTNDASGISTP